MNKSYDVSTQDGSHRAGLGTTLAVMSSCSHFTKLTPSPDQSQSTSGDSSPSDAVTPRERGNERHDVLARHTDTCHTLVTCHVSRVKCHDGGHYVKTLTAPPMLNIAGHTHIGLSIH